MLPAPSTLDRAPEDHKHKAEFHPFPLSDSPYPSLAPLPSSTQQARWVEAFNLWLNSRASPHTRRAYAHAWKTFLAQTSKLPWEVTRADIALWLDSQRAAGLSPSTLNLRLAALSSFYTYASEVYQSNITDSPLCAANPAHAIPRLKSCSYQGARYLTIKEARALLRAIPGHTLQGRRDYALFLAYLVTGRRNSEIRLLRYGDFEFQSLPSPIYGRRVGDEGVYYRWSGKGRARRDQCPLPVWQSIQQYLSRSGKLESIQPEDYIFTPLTDRAARLPNVDQSSWTRNQPLSSREVGRLLKKYAKRAGLNPTKIRVHTLRHTAAMLRKQAGDDLDQISAFLGHSSLATTQVYLHRLEGQTDSSWVKVAALLGLDSPPVGRDSNPDKKYKPDINNNPLYARPT